ncbi:MAG: glutaredoxin family protein [Candidatus Omnitrophota bacterium]
MRFKWIFVIFIMYCLVNPRAYALAETVRLKSGKDYQGEIIGHNESEIELWTEEGSVHIPYRMIDSIERAADESAELYPMLDDIKEKLAKIAENDEKRKYVYANSNDNERVELYMTSWCPYCKKMEYFLQKNKIDYVRYNIEYDQAANARYKKMGGDGVPLLKVGRQIIRGYNPSAVTRALR